MGPKRRLKFLGTAIVAAIGAAGAAHAQEARQFNRIVTPQTSMKLPAGARLVAAPRPVSQARIEAAVAKIAAAWNTSALGAQLADNFLDKSRLLTTLSTAAPRDAKLRVLSIQGIQVLAQFVQERAAGGAELVSRVSVTVRTEIEFNDPQSGFRRLDGTNELILLLSEPAP